MKKIQNLGKSLSKNEMKEIVGGYYPCKIDEDCLNSCAAHPTQTRGTYCKNGSCTAINCSV